MQLTFRRARADDLPHLVALLADDPLGAKRERLADPLPPEYGAAFAAIAADPNQHLIVGEEEGAIVACLQLTLLPGLAHQGAWRAQIEGVRVAGNRRGSGIGEGLLDHALGIARRHGCRIAQLTTDKSRSDARRFYERLGFVATHEGMKRRLD